MTHPAYPAARETAARVHPRFAVNRPFSTGPQAHVPDVHTIEAIIEAAFWASLRREELETPRISLAFVSPEQVSRPLLLQNPVPLAPQPLTRLGPAVERPGIHLGVWPSDGALQVWGATRSLPAWCFVLEVLAPGLLVIKHSRADQSGKFVNVAVLQGDQIKVVDQQAVTSAEWPPLITSLLGLETRFTSAGSANLLIQLAVSMRAHGRGGALLVVPTNTDRWRESILHPITYAIAPAFSAVADPLRNEQQQRIVEGIAGLTGVDGATILTDQYELLAFGAKILRRPGSPQVRQLVLTEPVEGAVSIITDPDHLGGTRHLSAAQFAQDQPDSIALVASQDGRFTVFAWSPSEEIVHARRIETLLL